ncbi:hypothetical protein JZ751_018944 [Albula glossodonta]|uniref:IF rod domain-containing protein n=1 Tax=Albula glossodonta TaxID=121402 RepID=A0A8T2MTN9_9TELE|nr:hypothetical protein JZ751_018944 [Albula glossodonta]
MDTPKTTKVVQEEEDVGEEEEEIWEEAVEMFEARENEETGTNVVGCTNDGGPQTEGSITEVLSQIEGAATEVLSQTEGSVMEVLPQREECQDDGHPQIEGCVTEVLSQIEECVNEVVSDVEGCLEKAGSHFEGCIEEVGQLEHRRDVLVAQLLQLEQPMAQAAQELRAELNRMGHCLARVELERRSLQEQVCQVKRRLFNVTRDCIQSQVTLSKQQHEVAQSAITQEELQAQIVALMEDVAQIREAQHRRLVEARDWLQGGGRRQRTRSDLTHCRRASADLQKFLRGGMNALDQRYEPRLLALLRRRQWGEEALRRHREQAKDLRAQVQPLEGEASSLHLQKACLEERIGLMELQRQQNLEQYRDTLEALEQSLRELRMETQVQKKRNEEMETLTSNMSKELDTHRTCETQLLMSDHDKTCSLQPGKKTHCCLTRVSMEQEYAPVIGCERMTSSFAGECVWRIGWMDVVMRGEGWLNGEVGGASALHFRVSGSLGVFIVVDVLSLGKELRLCSIR